MNIKHLRQRKADALAKAKAIFAAAEKENRELTDAERGEYDAAMASVETLNKDIARAERLLDEERTATPVVLDTNAVANVSVRENILDKPWASFGEQLSSIASAYRSGMTYIDPRLRASLGANEAVDADGGFLVNPEYSNVLWQRTYEVGQLASRCDTTPMSSNQLVLPAIDEDSRVTGSRYGGLVTYWTNEGAPYLASRPKTRKMTLTANKLTGLFYATEELMADGAALENYVQKAFPDEFAWNLDNCILNGTGSGQPLGINVTQVPVVVPKDSGQATATISTSNILNMWKRMWAPSRKNAAWFINQDTEAQLFSLTLGSGTAVILLYAPPGYNGNNSPYGMLMGRPVIPIEQAPTLGTQGDISLLDLTQYLIGKKGGMRADSSMHVAFLTGEMAFRFMMRTDGQPYWKKPLTPANGTNTLSPFVTLAARP